MLKTLFTTLLFLLGTTLPLVAQEEWQNIYEEWLEETDEETTATQQELLFDELSHLHDLCCRKKVIKIVYDRLYFS